MCRIRWLIIMDRPKAAFTDTALEAHGLETGTVLPSQGPIDISWISHISAPPAGKQKARAGLAQAEKFS